MFRVGDKKMKIKINDRIYVGKEIKLNEGIISIDNKRFINILEDKK